MLVSTPLSHIAALGSLAAMLLVGGTSVLSRPGAFDPAEVVRLLEAEKVTAAFFVPTQWTAICQVPGLSSRSLSLRTIGWGASPAPPATLAAISEIFPGLPLVATFGQTEMSPVTCVLDGADAVRKAGSVGRAVPTVAVRILDEDMHDVPDGEVGEIVYRGAPTMAGYWDNPAATAEAFAGGWFHSGDLVRRDDEGFIYVVDRKKDMIISGGENIYSAELEQVIGKHPLVRDVAVIGVPHPRWVETPLAVIEPADPGRPPMLDDIAAWCQQRLASYKKPTRLEIVDQLPRNPNGKTDKPALRARLAAG
jgi:acyl-CoA synthetase (AMP-forming)/AMP-acid ligase II